MRPLICPRPCRSLAGSLVALLLLGGCATLPPLEPREQTHALPDTADTRLGRALAELSAGHPNQSGVHPLTRPRDAFAARALLARAAERSIDVQYYIWHDDVVGRLLFDELRKAADRGVRVRVLLDDLNTKGLDASIAALDRHPNIQVRLYNPLAPRGVRVLSFLGDFQRVNRRMHNKAFIADNQVAIVGGRNVGDEYFEADAPVAFIDLDVALVGAAVPAVSEEFDHYWNSASAYPADRIVEAKAAAADEAPSTITATRASAEAADYLQAVRTTPMLQDLLERRLEWEWTTVRVLADDPAKTLDAQVGADLLLLPELVRVIGPPTRSLDLVTPYFVPGAQGAETLAAIARRGVAVRILTNSLAASDVGAVHAGYAKRREVLLKAGVRLFELKPTARANAEDERSVGSSASSGLHAKTFAVDGERLFVGSFNFDPRSARINTELGVVIESSALAQRLADAFDTRIPQAAYEVRLVPGGELQWIEQTANGALVHDSEPGATLWKRFQVRLFSVLPVEWLL